MKTWTWLLLSVLIPGVPPARSIPPPSTRKPGGKLQCDVGQYMYTKNGEPACSRCTPSCTGKKHLKEMHTCTETSDRQCKCEPGFFCPSPVNKTCRRDCESCTNGFTSEYNLKHSCNDFTECGSGEEVIKNGTSTRDRVCGKPGFKHKPNLTTATRDRTDTTTTTPGFQSSDPKFPTSRSGDVTRVSSQNPVVVLPSKTPGFDQRFGTTTGGPVPPPVTNSATTWIFFLLLLTTLGLILCLSLKCKGRAIKYKLEQAGLVLGRYQPVFPGIVSDTDAPAPGSNVTDQVRDQGQGQGSFPGKNQKVTMEHVGKSDGVNNTVGSIFIYSPGMVILGSNSNEKKEEASSGCEEEEEEEEEADVRLISVPQQESSSEDVSIRLATQEELDKELSIPVPATSK